MSYFEVGLFFLINGQNVGTLFRSAYQLGAAGVFTIGRRYDHQVTDTFKATRHLPLRHYSTFEDFLENRPLNAVLVGVEMGGTPLAEFKHPSQAVYLLSAEDGGLPPKVVEKCDRIVTLESVGLASYNVAVAGSIVLYHRMFLEHKGAAAG